MQAHVVPVVPLANTDIPHRRPFVCRDPALDTLLVATNPAVTRNHCHHDPFPQPDHNRAQTIKRQAPRRQRTSEMDPSVEDYHPPKKRRSSVTHPPSPESLSSSQTTSLETTPAMAVPTKQSVQVKCMARTRIPTPHGPAFLHLYHNDHDSKEHLAIVIDPVQLSESTSSPVHVPMIRSQTLDAVWSENETEMDRITRGAYVGRLSPTSQHASRPPLQHAHEHLHPSLNILAPLIRVHSECFTGETVGSMRCDCGEQLDEAIKRISQPINIPGPSPQDSPITIPGRGVVVYLRQEGRGIGLLSKLRAYNLQDLGHDTVTANLMLGYRADERGYEIAGAILHDLGLGVGSDGVRVLTNNPDKVEALQNEGVKVVERISMIPRSWQCRQHQSTPASSGISTPGEMEHVPGAMSLGGKVVYGDDLDRYLRTKITRMGHMLPLWMEEHEA